MAEKTFQVLVTSDNALYKNDLLGEYLFQFYELLTSENNSIHIKIVNAVFPISFYNINENNNILSLILNSNQNISITLPIGNYNGKSLAKTIMTLLNINNLSVIFNELTSKIEFYYNLPIEIDTSVNISILKILGFSTKANSLATFNISLNQYVLIATNPVNLSQTTHICIQIRKVDTNGYLLNSENPNDNLLCSIPINSQPMTNLTYINNDASIFGIDSERNNLQQFVLVITNQLGEILNFNGIPFSINLQFSFIRFTE